MQEITLKLGNTFYLNKILRQNLQTKTCFLNKNYHLIIFMTFLDQKFWNGSAGGSGRHGVPGIVIVKQQLRLSRGSPWGPVWVFSWILRRVRLLTGQRRTSTPMPELDAVLSFLSQPWDWHSVTITVLWLLTTVTQFHPFQVDCGHVLKWAQRRIPQTPGAFFGVSSFSKYEVLR